jgi:hypothetical protein
MERLKDYECPKVCEGRSKTCHSECERHQKYREIAEEIRNERFKAAWEDNLMGNKPFMKKKH